MANDKTYDRHINIWINGKEVRNTIVDIRKEFRAATKEIDLMTRGTAEYNAKAAEIKRLKGIMAEHSESLKVTGGMWAKFKDLIPMASIAGASAALLGFGKELFELSKTMESEARRSSIVFGDSLGYVQGEADKVAKKMGVTTKQFVAMAAATGDLLIPLGFTRQKSAEMSVELQKLTGALDEWTGGKLGAAEISNILTKAMLGENEQLKTLGIAIKLDSDEYKNLLIEKQKIPGVTKAQAQAMAELELIQAKSIDAQNAYTQGGNELLRAQKGLTAGWNTLKENIVDMFRQDAVGKLGAESKMVNTLTAELYNMNTPQERRLQIYNQLKTIAPDIVASLDSEMRATVSTRKALEEYNRQLINKIVLAKNDKQIEKEREQAAVATEKRLKAENEAIMAMQKAANANPASAAKINDILSQSTPVIEKLKQVKALGIDVNGTLATVYTGYGSQKIQSDFSADLQKALDYEKAQLDEMGSLLDERQLLADRLGIPAKSTITDSTATTTAVSNTVTNKVVNKKVNLGVNSADVTSALDTAIEGMSAGAQQMQDQWKKASEGPSDMTDYLKNLSQVSQNQQTSDLEFENDVEKQRAQMQRDRAQQKADEDKKAKEEELAAEQALTDQKSQLMNGLYGLGETLIDRRLSKLDEQYKADIAAAGDNAALKEKIETEYQKKRAALQRKAAIAEKIAGIFAIAIDTAKGAVNAASKVVTLPLVPWIIANGAVQAAIVAAQPIPKFAIGGFTKKGVKDEPAGIVHAGEWVASAAMVASPVTGPIIKALEQQRLTRGYASGGIVTPSAVTAVATIPVSTAGAAASQASDPELKAMLQKLSGVLTRLDNNGVNMKFGWVEADRVRKGIKKLTDIEDSVTL